MFPEPDARPLPLGPFRRLAGVADVIYNPLRSRLVLDARSRGIPAEGGLYMLVAQAVRASEHFLNTVYPDDLTDRIYNRILRQKENIVLIGMPGSGKSAVGEARHSLTGREILDMDAEIALRAGMPIPEIFAQYGEAHFRALEREVAVDFGLRHGKIIVTGGGVVKDSRNDVSLKRNGRVYCLQRELSALAREGRPLSEHADLAAMARGRAPMYERCMDVSIRNDGTVEQAAQRIWEDFLANAAK